MALSPEVELLADSIKEVRGDLVRMEERLTAKIDEFRPTCVSHGERLCSLERAVTSMDAQRKTIIGMVAFAGTIVGSVFAYAVKYLIGR